MVQSFLALDYLTMNDRFKADKAPELQQHAAVLAVLSEPRLTHACRDVKREIFAGQ